MYNGRSLLKNQAGHIVRLENFEPKKKLVRKFSETGFIDLPFDVGGQFAKKMNANIEFG
jgi:hypothetical protein